MLSQVNAHGFKVQAKGGKGSSDLKGWISRRKAELRCGGAGEVEDAERDGGSEASVRTEVRSSHTERFHNTVFRHTDASQSISTLLFQALRLSWQSHILYRAAEHVNTD